LLRRAKRLFLCNRESRRANGKLRSNKPNDLLATMYMLDGQVSDNYPKDLKELFTLRRERFTFIRTQYIISDFNAISLHFWPILTLSVDKIKTLMAEYGLPNITESRESNLNRLMQFCGVRYQLVE
jgi:hypothetical protein